MEFNTDDPQYHMGNLIMDYMKKYPNRINQLDSDTGAEETNDSVLKRSIKLAKYLRTLDLKPGDVLALGGTNHLDLHIPYYAALMNGLPVTGVDPLYKLDDIKKFFEVTKPKIAFCQEVQRENYLKAAHDLGLNLKVITFDGTDPMSSLIAQYCDAETTDFQPSTFDLDKVYIMLVATAGSTGVLKVAAFKHKIWITKLNNFTMRLYKPTWKETIIAMNTSSIHWVSGMFNAIGMLVLNQTKLMIKSPATTEYLVDCINKYKPRTALLHPLTAANLVNNANCQFSCFSSLVIGGAKLYKDIYLALKSKLSPNAMVIEIYGQTENLGPVFAPSLRTPVGSCGTKTEVVQVKLVDKDDLEITEPNFHGELWTKTECFTEYYNNPKLTAKAFSEDGWYKTGDIMYRDEQDFFFFVERKNMVIKTKSDNEVIPSDIEEVIRSHAGVMNVSVTYVHTDAGDKPVACVVRWSGATVTAQEIKDLVIDKLPRANELTGGVIFIDELPMTSSGKVALVKIREMAQTLPRE